jgi:hypothetical protein
MVSDGAKVFTRFPRTNKYWRNRSNKGLSR